MQEQNKDSKQNIALLPTQSSVSRSVGIFAAGIIIGVLLSWGYGAAVDRSITAGPNATSTTQGKQTTNNRSGAGIAIGTDGTAQSSFTVEDPQAAGKKVTITKAVVSKPTWIVVYDDVDGKPGRALGATLFTSQKQSGTVTLLRSTTAGKDYLVGQLADDGNKVFSLKSDKPVMVNGSPLLVGFTAK
jgi:hypothetical protein